MNLVAAFFSWCNAEDFHAQFAADLRTPLFVVFVSLSAFLFAIKAMLVTTLKREVCDTDSYRRLLAIQRVANPEFGHYAPLRRLSTLLLAASVAAALIAATQLTLGLVRANLAALVCVAAAVPGIVLLGLLPVALGRNIEPWLRRLEKDATLSKSRGGSASFDPPSGISSGLNPAASGRMPAVRLRPTDDLSLNAPSGEQRLTER
ncbi:MAG: hypothetical protein U0836_26650 [Pirellulales bacterium]